MSWINIEDELPPLDQPVFFEDKTGFRWLGARSFLTHEYWFYGNTYGSVWWDRKKLKWECDNDIDDDYQPVKWHKLPN